MSTIATLQIEGRSGCSLDLLTRDDKLVVRKTSSCYEYNERLKQQQLKQKSFSSGDKVKGVFFTPKTGASGLQNGLYWFEMDYISGEKYSSWFVKLNKNQIDKIIQEFVAYFEDRIALSSIIIPPNSIFINKLNNLLNNLSKNNKISSHIKREIEYNLSKPPEKELYINQCHGDFTLSNMLFLKNGKVCIFDLLDSFIESPIIDYIKLRQDTFFKWTMHVENENNKHSTKLIQVLDYIDYHLQKAISKYPIFQDWEIYLTIFNMARILPYAKDERDIEFIENKLTTLLK